MVEYRSNLFRPENEDPFKISRSKIELFLECPKCFYLDRRLGVSRPSIPAFTLNSAVDVLMKKEFDIHRNKGTTHPLMKAYKINAIPLAHEKMDQWRENFKGVGCLYKPTNFWVFGAVDDIWINSKGEMHVVDYKSTSTTAKISLDDEYKQAYKRQMEIYQWLLRQNNFVVSNTGYFVYVNGRKDKAAFDGKLEFDIQLITYEGNASWVEKILKDIYKVLLSDQLPKSKSTCHYCSYRNSALNFEKN
jgi:CRISPR/Cas system-associated exonuclease Cas4 (RecB family)